MSTYTPSLSPRLLLGTGSLFALVCVTPVHAAGVNAGTLIENTASATFKAGSQTGTIRSNKVVIRVDELLDVAVTSLAASELVLQSETGVLPFAVTNSGNGPEAFVLTVDAAMSGNQFSPQIIGLAIDSNDNGTYEAGVDQMLAGGAQTPVLASDGAARIFVLAALPDGASDAQLARVQLVAAAATGSGAPGTSFADKGEGGGNAVVGLTTARNAAQAAMRSSLASVSLIKSARVVDPFGGTAPIPGAKVTYQLVAEVSGSGIAQGLAVTDVIPAGTTYTAGSLSLDGAALTDGEDGDAGKAGSSGVSVALGDAAGGTRFTVNFTVQIN